MRMVVALGGNALRRRGESSDSAVQCGSGPRSWWSAAGVFLWWTDGTYSPESRPSSRRTLSLPSSPPTVAGGFVAQTAKHVAIGSLAATTDVIDGSVGTQVRRA